jgi:hypothetical protein
VKLRRSKTDPGREGKRCRHSLRAALGNVPGKGTRGSEEGGRPFRRAPVSRHRPPRASRFRTPAQGFGRTDCEEGGRGRRSRSCLLRRTFLARRARDARVHEWSGGAGSHAPNRASIVGDGAAIYSRRFLV